MRSAPIVPLVPGSAAPARRGEIPRIGDWADHLNDSIVPRFAGRRFSEMRGATRSMAPACAGRRCGSALLLRIGAASAYISSWLDPRGAQAMRRDVPSSLNLATPLRTQHRARLAPKFSSSPARVVASAGPPECGAGEGRDAFSSTRVS